MYNDTVDWLMGAVFVIVLVVMGLLLFVVVPAQIRADNMCLKHGFPGSYITTSGSYCTRTVNQTQYVCATVDEACLREVGE